MQKIIIAGLRNFTNYPFFRDKMDSFLRCNFIDTNNIEFVSGGASGVDFLAEKYSAEKKIPIKVFPADWMMYGKSAGPIRNSQMADYAGDDGVLIAFWDYHSRGTGHMVRTAKKKGMLVHIVNVNDFEG